MGESNGGCMKPVNHNHEYSTKDIKQILERYQNETAAQIALSMGRTKNGINSVVRQNEVTKREDPPFSDFETAIIMSGDKPKTIELILNRDRKSIIDKRYKTKRKQANEKANI